MFALDGGNDVRFEGEDFISTHQSTEWAERGFCSKCGTHLFIRVKQSGRYILPTGLFDRDLPDLVFDHQIFVDQRPSYYCFANETREQTGPEVFAGFAANQSD